MLPTLEDLIANEELHKAIERTRHPAIKPEAPPVSEAKQRVYVC